MATKQQVEKAILLIENIREQINESLTEHFGNLEIALDEAGLKDISQVKESFESVSDYEMKISIALNKLQRLLTRIKNSVSI